MRTFIECAIQSVAFNRNHPLLLNNNLRSNINHKLQFNNYRNNLNKNTEKKIQAGWCLEDFIGNFANATTAAETAKRATRSSPPPPSSSPPPSVSLMSCFNQVTTSLSSVLSSNTSSNSDYSSPSSASSAKKTNLFYRHRKAFRRKEDNSVQQIFANITITAITTEYLLVSITSALLLTLYTTMTSLVGSTNFATTRS